MEWAILIGIFAFMWLRSKSARRRERIEIARTTGMIRSALYHAQMALQVTLIVLAIWLGHVQKVGGWILLFVWGAMIADVVALLLVRRALRWRYPV